MKTKTVWLGHPSEDAWEDYARHRLSEVESAPLEAHLLACDSCQEALQGMDDFILALRENREQLAERLPAKALGPVWARLQDRTGLKTWMRGLIAPTPGRAALAGATALLVAVAVLHRPPVSPEPPAPVTLTAFRGGDPAQGATAPAGRALALAIDAADIPVAMRCRVEVVNATGQTVWSGVATAAEGQLNLTVPEALDAGIYWVRLYTGGSEPVREFGLRLK